MLACTSMMHAQVSNQNSYTSVWQDSITFTQDLKDVVIKADRIRKNANGYTVSMVGSELGNVNTSKDVLAFLPGITINNDKINLFGKKPIVYVDGIKITSEAELNAITPSRIQKIKVDYLSVGEGATDKGGVIRITLKKVHNGGLSGNLSARMAEMPYYGHQKDGATLSLRSSINKWSVNYWASYNHNKNLDDSDNSYFSKSTGLLTISEDKIRSWNKTFSNRLNISYEISPKSTLAVSEYLSNNDTKGKRSSIKYSFFEEKELSQTNTATYSPEHTFTQQTVTKYLLNTDENGSNLVITADYLQTKEHMCQEMVNDGVTEFANATNEKTDMFRFSPKYSLVLNEKGNQLQFGGDYQMVHYTDKAQKEGAVMDALTPSAFVNYSAQIHQLMLSAGLTLQYNKMTVKVEDVENTNDNWVLCPQLNLMWILNKKFSTSLMVMYQRGTEAIPYSVINTYKKYDTYNHYTIGNPTIKTPTEDQWVVRFNANKQLALTLMYYRNGNSIYYMHDVDENQSDITYSKAANSHYEAISMATLEYNDNLTKWWKIKAEAGIMNTKSCSQTIKNNGFPCGKFRWNNLFTFTNTFGGYLNGYWETGLKFQDYSWKPVGNFEASVYRLFFKKHLRLSLTSTLWAKGRQSTVLTDSYTSICRNKTRSSSFLLTATWYFDKGKPVKRRSEATSIQEYTKYEEKK